MKEVEIATNNSGNKDVVEGVYGKDLFIGVCRSTIKRDGIDDLLEYLEKSDFYSAPASTRFHGNYECGLLHHSLHVYYCLQELVLRYQNIGLLRDIKQENISVAALFHDICKINYYKKGFRNVKNPDTNKWEQKEVYEVDERFPIGHGEKSVIMLQQFMKLTVDEMLAIRWHMGGFDSAVKGGDFSSGKAYDKCKLAPLLHIADMEASYMVDKKVV